MYTMSTIESYDDFLVLEPEWEELRTRNNFTLFSSHAWYKCLLDSCQGTKEPFIVIVRCSQGHDIVGILPLEKLKKYQLTGLTSLVNTDTQRFDFICDKLSQKDIIDALLTFLLNLKSVHYLILTPVAEKDSPLFDYLSNDRRCALRSTKRSPYLSCNQTFQQAFDLRSKVSKKNSRNLINRFSKLGEISIEKLLTLTGADFEDCLMISQGSWKGDEGVAIGSDETSELFFRHLSQVASDNGWLRVWFLTVNGKRVAMEYHLKEGTVEYALRGDYLDHFKKHSPGRYLDYFVVKDLCDSHDVETYDMCGDEYSYKMKWTKNCSRYYKLYCFKNNLVHWLYKTKRIINQYEQ